MKKAFLESKWWFYIPILSYIRFWEISEWVMNGEKELDRMYRHLLVFTITILQSILALKLFLIFFLNNVRISQNYLYLCIVINKQQDYDFRTLHHLGCFRLLHLLQEKLVR